MTNQAEGKRVALWIDHRRAIVVTLINDVEATTIIESDVERQLGRTDGVRSNVKHEAVHVPHDDSRDRKFNAQIDVYYDRVIAAFQGAQTIAIFGPGEAKGELRKRIEKTVPEKCVVSVETADKMTTPEIEAKARVGFHPMARRHGES
ncbi:MAG: hypothetical protein K8T90_20645 [Planctomycetes bacterium]|nr:hypothetical protein [Planctomycetota bacterium]